MSGVTPPEPAAGHRATPFAATPPARVEHPADREALSRLLEATSGAVVPIDGARERALSAPLDADDWMAVDVRGLDRLVDWQPDDLTVTVESGLPMTELATRLAERGQWLPLEAPGLPSATVGHVVAEALAGARATRFGGPRRHLIGLSTIDGRGVLTRAGGRLVKNVAGYDLMKLHAGARETLGLLVELTFRLQPLPEAVIRLVGRSRTSADLPLLVDAVALAGLEPDLFRCEGDAGAPGVTACLEFSGFAEDVRDEGAAVRDLAASWEWTTTELPGTAVLDAAVAGRDGAEPGTVDRVDVDYFSTTAGGHRAFDRLSAWAERHPAWGRRLEWDPFPARGRLVGPPVEAEAASDDGADRVPTSDPPRDAGDLEQLRTDLTALDTRVALRGRGAFPVVEPDRERRHRLLDGTPPASLDLLRRLKSALDPARRFQPGRFFWGL